MLRGFLLSALAQFRKRVPASDRLRDLYLGVGNERWMTPLDQLAVGPAPMSLDVSQVKLMVVQDRADRVVGYLDAVFPAIAGNPANLDRILRGFLWCKRRGPSCLGDRKCKVINALTFEAKAATVWLSFVIQTDTKGGRGGTGVCKSRRRSDFCICSPIMLRKQEERSPATTASVTVTTSVSTFGGSITSAATHHIALARSAEQRRPLDSTPRRFWER